MHGSLLGLRNNSKVSVNPRNWLETLGPSQEEIYLSLYLSIYLPI